MDVEDDQPEEELESREPSVEDLVALCGELNSKGARYLVVGGFAIRGAGYLRATMDIDLLIDASEQNEAKVYDAMRSLPDRAVDPLKPGDVARFTVVRVADEAHDAPGERQTGSGLLAAVDRGGGQDGAGLIKSGKEFP
jgi:hypothetical protein